MNIVSAKQDILENCKDPEYREAFVSENVYTAVCSQIRVLREQREWSQKRLGRKAGMAQERISILEDSNATTKPTIGTLLRLATAFSVGLDIRFVPFSTVLDRAVHTGDTELEVPSFDEELPILEQELAAEVEAERLPGNATKVVVTEQQVHKDNIAAPVSELEVIYCATRAIFLLQPIGNPGNWAHNVDEELNWRGLPPPNFDEYGRSTTTSEMHG